MKIGNQLLKKLKKTPALEMVYDVKIIDINSKIDEYFPVDSQMKFIKNSLEDIGFDIGAPSLAEAPVQGVKWSPIDPGPGGLGQ